MSNKQSSVEWLMEQVCNLDWKNIQGEKKLEILEQAKAMHKEEMIQAWDNAAIDATYGNKFSSAEQYYNKTYGGNK